MKLKCCGMKYNTSEVAKVQPDYMGFIFWKPSTRDFTETIPVLPEGIRKVGVFVDASIATILQEIKSHELDLIQLHGAESGAFCTKLKQELKVLSERKNKPNAYEIIKAFNVGQNFDFAQLSRYEEVCDYYLFDAKGKLPGGNGKEFNWTLLEQYTYTKPYFLSGGVSLQTLDKLKSFFKSPAAEFCHAIDVNSGFEEKPGLKKADELEKFKTELEKLVQQ